MPERYVCTLSPELLQKAKEQVNEVADRRADDIQAIREWLKKQPHIHGRTDDAFILRFLRGCKFSLERTKEKIDTYYTVKTASPEMLQNRDPLLPELQEIIQLGIFLPLPGYDSMGRKVSILRIGLQDTSRIKIQDLFKVNLMMQEILLEDDEQMQICGFVGLLDMQMATLAHAAQMTPDVVKRAFFIFQEAYPIRPKGINYWQMPDFFHAVFKLFKSFMKPKMKDRLHLHGKDLDSLHKQIPKEILPREYGGTNGTVQELAQYWRKVVEDKRDWFIKQEAHGTDESKRLGKPKDIDEILGLEGSFRRLEVD